MLLRGIKEFNARIRSCEKCSENVVRNAANDKVFRAESHVASLSLLNQDFPKAQAMLVWYKHSFLNLNS